MGNQDLILSSPFEQICEINSFYYKNILFKNIGPKFIFENKNPWKMNLQVSKNYLPEKIPNIMGSADK